jgi:hypothetical protein
MSMHDEAKLIFDACETSDLAKITDAFQHAVAEIDAAGPEHAVESMEELFAALRDVGMSEDHIEELAEDIGREVTPEIQRALAVAWRPERLQ